MYPRNAASPEPVAIGAVIQITDGAVQTSGVTVRIKPIGVAEADGGGTTAYSTDGIILYTPTQAETNYTSFILIAKKTGCIPTSVTVVTSASATAGYAGTDQSKIANPTSTVALTGTTIATTQKVDVETIKTNPVVNGGTITFPSNATVASTTNITAGTITTVTTVTNQLTAAQIATGVWQDTTAGDFTTALSVGKSLMNGVALGTGLTVARCTLTDTLTTYTGNTPQTGDSFARIGAAGAGLTAVGDTRMANLDAAISSRMATYTQPTGFLAATFPTTVASTTNITAGTITTVTNLTNAPSAGDFTATMKTSIGTAVAASAVASVTGAVGSVTGNVGGNVTGSVGSVVGAVGSVTGSVGSVVGAVGSVTGNVGGNVTGSVGSVATGGIAAASFAAGAITAAAIATDAIDADAIAASAVTEIQSGLSTLTAAAVNAEVDTALSDVGLTTTITGRIDVAVSTRLASASYTAPLDAAGTRTAVGLGAANLDTQLNTIYTVAGLVQAKTDNLPSDPADASDVAAAFATVNATLATLTAYVDTEVAAIKVVTDAIGATGTGLSAIPWNASWDAEVQSEVDDALKAALTEGYRSTGATGSVRDLLYEIIAHMGECSISGTTKTTKRLDGTTTAKTYTLDSSSAPTSISETT